MEANGFISQTTLRSSISCTGTGLHTGERVTMTLHPGEADAGIVFRRTDIRGSTPIPAHWRYIVDSHLCTVLGTGNGVRIGTVEHLMAAFAGSRVDNAVVEIDGPEVPIMDGSAAPFVFLIECAGLEAQDVPRRAIQVRKPVVVSEGGRSAALLPSGGFSIHFEIDFDSPAVAQQACSVDLENGVFKAELARARTFGFEHEVTRLRREGYARGGSLHNAVVVSGDQILNKEGLRYADEFVRHKIVDCIGDLYLAGGPVIGHFRGVQSGHGLTHRLLAEFFADETAWRERTLADPGHVSPSLPRPAQRRTAIA